MRQFSPYLSFSFIALVAVLYSALVVGAVYAQNRINESYRFPIYALRLCVGGFLLIVGLLGLQGTFHDFTTKPPSILIPVVIALAGAFFLAFHPRMTLWLRELPSSSLILLQSFRIVVEVQLFFLAKTTFFPTLMTWEGRNWDVLTGLTAPIVAHFVHHAGSERALRIIRPIAIVWNVLGLVLLVNVALHGLLSSPVPFRVFHVEPANTALAYFPFVWLPTFVVPFALLLHLLSLRKLTMEDAPSH